MVIEELKYGHIRGTKCSNPVAVDAITFKAKSGRFVYLDDGVAKLNIDGSTRIFGFVEAGDETTVAGDKKNCIDDLNAVFKIPIDSGTYVVGMQGDYCDLAITSDVQGAQLDAGVEQTLIIVGGDEVDNLFVLVRMNPVKWGTGAAVTA